MSEHSVRAYRGDVTTLLEHAARMGRYRRRPAWTSPVLRSWLAGQAARGEARTTLARRAAAARSFTAWATRERLLADRPRCAAGHPAGRADAARRAAAGRGRALLEVAGLAADDGSPTALRDLAVLEVLYASGIRVGELCGLDLDDVDRGRRVVRVLGKGAKERAVPVGLPGAAGLDAWLAAGRPRLARRRQRAALFLGARGGGSTPGRCAGSSTSCSRTCPGHPTWGRTASAIRPPPTCWRAEPT